MCLTSSSAPPNLISQLTADGIEKVINKQFPVMLQVLSAFESNESHASDKVSLILPGGHVTRFSLSNNADTACMHSLHKIVLPDGTTFIEDENSDCQAVAVRPMFHISDGNSYIQAIIRKHPLFDKCILAGLKKHCIITVTKAVTSWFHGNVGLLEIYDFSLSEVDCAIVGCPSPQKDTLFSTPNDGSFFVNWTKPPMTYSGVTGCHLPCGKWLLEEDKNSSDDVNMLLQIRCQVAKFAMTC